MLSSLSAKFLLEFVLLATKLPVKPVAIGMPPPPVAAIYVEKAPVAFFERLQSAGQTVIDLCLKIRQRYGAQATERGRGREAPANLEPIYNILGNMSVSGQPIPKATNEWYTIAPLVKRLARHPNVTADAYRHIYGGTELYLQWCTAMAAFEGRMSDGTPVEGADLLFVEGWNDVIAPLYRGPLSNSVWREVLNTITLDDLRGWTVAPL